MDTEPHTQTAFRIPNQLMEALEQEAKTETRSLTGQLQFILHERYKKKPRLEEKQQRGKLRK